MRKRRLGFTGELRTEARSRAFLIFWSVMFRSVQSFLVQAKNSSSAGVRSLAGVVLVDDRVVTVVVRVLVFVLV